MWLLQDHRPDMQSLRGCLPLHAACSCASGAEEDHSTCQPCTLGVKDVGSKATLMLGFLEQVVVILGTGAFACEAMEAGLRNGAKHVYLLSRERIR